MRKTAVMLFSLIGLCLVSFGVAPANIESQSSQYAPGSYEFCQRYGFEKYNQKKYILPAVAASSLLLIKGLCKCKGITIRELFSPLPEFEEFDDMDAYDEKVAAIKSVRAILFGPLGRLF